MFSSSELILIRHAAADSKGRLCGRTDIGLLPGSEDQMGMLSGLLSNVASVRVSPARRCRETLAGIWRGDEATEDERFWEQDFGDWDGRSYDDIPDLGRMERRELAGLATPGGESFEDLVRRVGPALQEAASMAGEDGPVAIVAHAGVVRAALSIALGENAAGLAFEVDPLSLTRLRCLPGGGFAIISVNWVPQ